MTHAAPSRDPDDLSLVGYVNAQGGLAAAAAELRDQGQRLLAAGDSQPLAPAVRENLAAFVQMTGALASVGEGLVPAARRQHEADFARAEEPRGSRAQEVRADVTSAEADGY